jgi:signal transduction histidine kinase
VVNDVTIDILTSKAEDFHHAMEQCMERLARCADVELIYLWRISYKDDEIHYHRLYRWLEEDGLLLDTEPDRMDYPLSVMPLWAKKMLANQCVSGPMSEVSEDCRDTLSPFGIRSMLDIPLFTEDQIWGIISFDDCKKERRFEQDEIDILRSGGLLVANAIIRHEMTQNLVLAREEAISGTKAKSDFLANMSHEIRTPINAITGMTAIAQATTDPVRKEYCLTKIQDASNHLLGIVTDILDMSKIESGKLELEPGPFQFPLAIEQVVNALNFRVQEKEQTFACSLDPRIPVNLIGDEWRIRQVITNLVSNAIKFTPNHGKVELKAELLEQTDTDCQIKIEVRDTGIGISSEQQELLFQSFEQVDVSTSRRFGGTGLGLALSKNIAQLLQGDIWVESELDQGATFYFTMRLGIQAKVVEVEQPQDDSFEGFRILLVEDVEINREIVLAMLEDTKLVIDSAENGLQAVELFSQSKYDLVFMDLKMPEMDGYEATRRIRQVNPTVPIIAMTANVFREDIEKCLEVGMNSHIGKPVDFEVVLDHLRKYLRSA